MSHQKGQAQAEGKGWDRLDNSFWIPSPGKGLLHASPISHASAMFPEIDLETQLCALHKYKAMHKPLHLSRMSNTSRMHRYSQPELRYPALWQELSPLSRARAAHHLLPKDHIV